MTEREQILQELAEVINRHSMENPSGTPDFILAEYLLDCLGSWNRAAAVREEWYGRAPVPCGAPATAGLRDARAIFTGQACSDGGEHTWGVRATADASGRVERYCLKCHIVMPT
jgi:hypothetical protein